MVTATGRVVTVAAEIQLAAAEGGDRQTEGEEREELLHRMGSLGGRTCGSRR
jgi:hypothetical protein